MPKLVIPWFLIYVTCLPIISPLKPQYFLKFLHSVFPSPSSPHLTYLSFLFLLHSVSVFSCFFSLRLDLCPAREYWCQCGGEVVEKGKSLELLDFSVGKWAEFLHSVCKVSTMFLFLNFLFTMWDFSCWSVTSPPPHVASEHWVAIWCSPLIVSFLLFLPLLTDVKGTQLFLHRLVFWDS